MKNGPLSQMRLIDRWRLVWTWYKAGMPHGANRAGFDKWMYRHPELWLPYVRQFD